MNMTYFAFGIVLALIMAVLIYVLVAKSLSTPETSEARPSRTRNAKNRIGITVILKIFKWMEFRFQMENEQEK